jgi:hypothetical protein
VAKWQRCAFRGLDKYNINGISIALRVKSSRLHGRRVNRHLASNFRRAITELLENILGDRTSSLHKSPVLHIISRSSHLGKSCNILFPYGNKEISTRETLGRSVLDGELIITSLPMSWRNHHIRIPFRNRIKICEVIMNDYSAR